jgi:DNA-binding IclR family transcriptional regulator
MRSNRRIQNADQAGGPQVSTEIPNSKEDPDFVASAARAFAVLEAVGQAHSPGNAELAEQTGLPKATVARLTGTLLKLGYIVEGPGGRGYQIGARAMSLGYAYIARHDIGELVQPVLRELSDTFPCATSLVTRAELDMIYLAQARSRSARLMINVGIGSRVPIAVSAGGRAYLAGCPAAERDCLMEMIEAADCRAWPNLKRGLQAALKEFSEFGFCSAFNVNGSRINAVSTPLRSGGNLYSLTCASPATLGSVEQMMNEIGPALMKKKITLQSRLP